MKRQRYVLDVPEGGTHITDLHKYRIIDADDLRPLGEGVTREWVFTYCNVGEHWRTTTFIQHAPTKESAFDSFIQKFPNTEVKRLEYMGLWW